ncbi:MAG: tetratricopeptide repeat protein [Proteobacteria bacterium]|nr:tetratricopeptide repeat protein [Pseudomonadota bacterium]
MKTSSKICAIFLIFFSQKSFAEDYVSTADVLKEIEKTLIFDKSSREQVDFYQKKNSARKSEVSIESQENSPEKKTLLSTQMSVVVNDAKKDNIGLREKEQLAYNAVLIGQYEVAIELYKQVLKSEPNNNYSKFALATVYQKIGQFRQAKTIYYQMLKSGVENQNEVVGNLLDILIEDSPQDATYLLSRLVVQNPDAANLFAYAALAYSKVKNYEQAISMLQKAINLDSSNLDYKYNLAVIYDRTEKYGQAVELYSQVIRDYSSDNQTVPLDKVKKRLEFISEKI